MDEARWERMERTVEFLLKQQADAEARSSAAEQRFNEQMMKVLRVQSGLLVLIETSIARQTATDGEIRDLAGCVQKLRDAHVQTDERLNALDEFVNIKLGRRLLN